MKCVSGIVQGITLLLLLTACSSQKNVFVLLPDQDGNVGSIEVVNDQGSYFLDKSGEGVSVAGSTSKPEAAPAMSEEQIKSTFGEALAVEPLQPQSFLLYFHSDSSELVKVSSGLIQPILDTIKARQSRDISVIGHTDRAGTKEYNLILSTQRARAIRDILVKRGVDPATLEVSSHGEGNPLVPTKDNVSEPRNRRVEIIVR